MHFEGSRYISRSRIDGNGYKIKQTKIGGINMKKIVALVMSTVMAFSLIACSKTSEASNNTTPSAGTVSIAAPSSPKKFSMASGSVGGNFYLMGGGIATTITKRLPDYFMFTSETTGGGTANLVMLQNGDAELGIAMTSSLSEALAGTAKWTNGQSHDKIRTALALYPSWLTVYTKKSSGIKTMQDLNGKIVGLGSKGMAMDEVFRKFFEAQGIVPKQIHNDGHAATATALSDGSIDAAILFSYPPFAAISEVENNTDLFFVPLTDAEQTYFTEKYGFYTKDEMPGGVYKGAPDSVKGISEWNILASSSEVSADDVYLTGKSSL